MRRSQKSLIGFLLALSVLATPASAQEVRGGLQFDAETGYLTNSYLHPSASFWDPTMHAPYGGLSPAGWLSWSGRSSSAQLAASGQHTFFQNGPEPWMSGRLNLQLNHAFGGTLTLGLDGGAGIFDGSVRQHTAQFLPRASWNPNPWTRLTARTGYAHQELQLPSDDGFSSSATLVSLEFERWLGFRSRLGTRFNASRIDLPEQEHGFTGLGGAINFTHRLPEGISLRAELGLEQYGYQIPGESPGPVRPMQPTRTDTETQNDYLWRATLSGEWPITSQIALIARSTGSHFQSSATDETVQDIQASLGFRVSIGGSLYEPRSRHPLWTQENESVSFRIPYEGPGELYLVGDFNEWERPGIPLRQEEAGIYSTHLNLDPGSYTYRVYIEGASDKEWLTLPEHALTVTDDYGGRNGLLIVEPDESN